MEEKAQAAAAAETIAETPVLTSDPILDITENFDDHPHAELLAGGEFALYGNMKWTIWESIDYINADKQRGKHIEKDAWLKTMRKVAWFDNLISFHQAWKKIPHATVKNVLYDDDTKTFKQFQDFEQTNYQVNAIQMFLHGVKPAWEDPVNAKGSEFKVDLGQLRENDKV